MVLVYIHAIIFIVYAFAFLFYFYIKNNKDVSEKDLFLRFILVDIITFFFIFQICLLIVPLSLDNIDDARKIVLIIFVGSFTFSRIVKSFTETIYRYQDVVYDCFYAIYLRSFKVDKENKESLLLKTINRYFKVFAIGDPNTVINGNSFHRIYAPDSSWKDAVLSLMKNSEIIVIRVGDTKGTIWEINSILQLDYLKKTIFCIYSSEEYQKLYSRFCLLYDDFPLLDISSDFSSGIALYLTKNQDSLQWNYHLLNNKGIKEFVASYVNSSEKLIKRCLPNYYRSFIGRLCYGIWSSLTSEEKYRFILIQCIVNLCLLLIVFIVSISQ